MLQLVRKLNARFSRKATAMAPAANATSPAAMLPRKPGPQAQRWSEGEARILLQWEREHRSVHAELENARHAFQTLIIGVDLASNQLLLDALFPAPPVAQMISEQPFWVTLPLAQGDFRLCVQARDLLPGRELLVDIVATQFAARSAEVHELAFQDERSPRAQLRINSGQSLSGRVRTLTSRGATLALPISVVREKAAPGTVAECAISFNDRFTVHCRASVTHTQRVNGSKLLHLEFVHLDHSNKAQLEAYMRSCQIQSA